VSVKWSGSGPELLVTLDRAAREPLRAGRGTVAGDDAVAALVELLEGQIRDAAERLDSKSLQRPVPKTMRLLGYTDPSWTESFRRWRGSRHRARRRGRRCHPRYDGNRRGGDEMNVGQL
jgi:hypothetical protein